MGAIIEGEGEIILRPRTDGRGRGVRVGIAVTNTEVEVISTCLRFVGDGYVYAAHNRRPRQRPVCWMWRLQAKAALRDLLPQIIPYLAGKQDKAILALSVVEPAWGGARVHPSQKPRREVDKKFVWRFGHDPNDPEAHQESGWQYLKLDWYTITDPDQRNLLTGGPDTGWKCWECKNNTYRAAAARDVLWVLTQPNVSVIGDLPDQEELKRHEIVIWACPGCGALIQWWREHMPPFKDVPK